MYKKAHKLKKQSHFKVSYVENITVYFIQKMPHYEGGNIPCGKKLMSNKVL